MDHFSRSAFDLLDALEHKYSLAAIAAESHDEIGKVLTLTSGMRGS